MENQEVKERSTPEEGTTPQEGTTRRLFPERFAKQDESTEAPPEEAKEEEKAEEPKSEPEQETETRDEKGRFKEAEAEPEYLSLEDFGEKMVKVKIGGEEKEIPLRDAIRGYQTDQHLTQKGQKVAEEYRKLQEMRAESPKKESAPSSEDDNEALDYFGEDEESPIVKALKQEIEGLKEQFTSVSSVIEPMKLENSLKGIDEKLREQGYEDFLEHRGEIQRRILDMPMEQQVEYDTEQGVISIYKDIKLEELNKELKSGKSEVPDKRPTPKKVSVEGGDGSASGADDNVSRRKKLISQAKESGGGLDAWAQVMGSID